MAESKTSVTTVTIELYKGKSLRIGKTNGKLYGGIITFKQANPLYPVIWLGQKSYTIYDVQTKKNILYYDTLTGMLFKPSELSDEEDNIDMVAQATQNVLIGKREAENQMGIVQASSSLMALLMGAMILVFVLTLVFIYIIWTHAPAPSTTYIVANATVANALTNANHVAPTTTVYGLGGPSIVPVPTS